MTVRDVINTLKPGWTRGLLELAARVRTTRGQDAAGHISYKTLPDRRPHPQAPAGARWRYIERIEIRNVDSPRRTSPPRQARS